MLDKIDKYTDCSVWQKNIIPADIRLQYFKSIPKKISLNELSRENAIGRIQIIYDDIEFETCIVPKQSNRIVFFISAGYQLLPDKSNYPTFHRSSWSDFIDGVCVYMDDAGKPFKGGGYLYDKSINLVYKMVSVIKHFIHIFDIQTGNVVFIGSSLGGYAAMQIASYIPSLCLAYSPIFNLSALYDVLKNKSKIEQIFGIRFDDKKTDIFSRFDITDKIIAGTKSVFFITFNTMARIDMAQINSISNVFDITPKNDYKLTTINDNINFYVYNIDCLQPHINAQPDEFFTNVVIENFSRGAGNMSHSLLHAHLKTFQRYLKLHKKHNKCSKFISWIRNNIDEL